MGISYESYSSYECDRCHYSQGRMNPPPQHLPEGYIRLRLFIDSENGVVEDRILCPDCEDQYHKFMRNETCVVNTKAGQFNRK